MTLPLFLNKKNKYVYSLIALFVSALFYSLSNHFLFFSPHPLPMTPLDLAVPFVPQTVWIYNSDGFLFFSAYIFSNNLANANKYLYSLSALLLVSVTIFFLWPTTYPRQLYPLPSALDHWTAAVFNNLRTLDAPTNCLPSLHVSVSYLSAFIYLGEQREKFPVFFSYATLVALSTLTTKQHYLVDVVTGLILAIIIYFIFHRVIRYKS